MSGWGTDEWGGAHFNSVNARRVAEQAAAREALAAHRMVWQALKMAGLVVLVLFAVAWLT